MQTNEIERVISVIKKLRDPHGGCPWDLEQTHKSLLKYLIEESYEYSQAVEEDDTKAMEEELGDVFLQVLLHSQIASEEKRFDLNSISKVLADKMIRRHPHVFDSVSGITNSEEVKANWQEIKKKEKAKSHTIMIEDAYAPSLVAAMKIGKKSKEINFDWSEVSDVIGKVDEELAEVKVELKSMQSKERIKDEIGDLLFSVAQLARHLDIDPEDALKQANLKFIKRINLVEDKARALKINMEETDTEELEKLWITVKTELKND